MLSDTQPKNGRVTPFRMRSIESAKVSAGKVMPTRLTGRVELTSQHRLHRAVTMPWSSCCRVPGSHSRAPRVAREHQHLDRRHLAISAAGGDADIGVRLDVTTVDTVSGSFSMTSTFGPSRGDTHRIALDPGNGAADPGDGGGCCQTGTIPQLKPQNGGRLMPVSGTR